MPFKRKKTRNANKQVIGPTMVRDLVWSRDILIPSNCSSGEMLQYNAADGVRYNSAYQDGDTKATGDIKTFAPTYLLFSANSIADIVPNIPINCIEKDETKLNFGLNTVETDRPAAELDENGNVVKPPTIDRKSGVLETLNLRKQVPLGYSEAAKHYNKYKVLKSSISVDLVPCASLQSDAPWVVGDGNATTSSETYPGLDVNRADAITSVMSLHQQMFRTPGNLYEQLPDEAGAIDRRVHLKRVITAGTRLGPQSKLYKKNIVKAADADGDSQMDAPAVGNESTELVAIDKDHELYDPLSRYSYLPWLDTSYRFHQRWPKTPMYVIPAFADKISQGNYPGRKHMFHSSWTLPTLKSEDKHEYDAHLLVGRKEYQELAGDYFDDVQHNRIIDNSFKPGAAPGTLVHNGDKDLVGTTRWALNRTMVEDPIVSRARNAGRIVPQREHFYVLRVGGQDVLYPYVRDTLSAQNNHSYHTVKVTIRYKVMFFDRHETLRDMRELQDTTLSMGLTQDTRGVFGITTGHGTQVGTHLHSTQGLMSLKNPHSLDVRGDDYMNSAWTATEATLEAQSDLLDATVKEVST